MSPSSFFNVELKQTDTISAALPLSMPEQYLPVSNLDLLIPPFSVSTFFCYKNVITNQTYSSFGSKVTALKKSLAQALVLYYPFAGEITMNSVGEPQLLCNNRGVDFFQVHADVDLVDLNMHNPDESIGDIMVPSLKNGTLAIQVTKLRCGSIIIGCTFDHRVADAHSMNMFLVSWAEMAQSKPISIKPNFQRSLLNPRTPVNSVGHASIDNLYATISSLPPPPQNPPPIPVNHRILRRIYVIPATELHRLQTLASSSESGVKCSKLVSFTSYLWRLIAKCDSENGKDALTTRLGIVVNGRSRLVNDKSTDGQETNRTRQMMEAYFGNVLSIPYGEESVGKLNQTDLNQTANNVVQFLKAGTSMEHFLNLIDWVEVHRPEPTLAKVYCSGTGDESALVISCGRGFPSREVDFGWGRPWIGSYHFPLGGTAGYVMTMPSPARNGDWLAYTYLRVEQVEVVDKFAGDVFKPITKAYLDSIV